MVKPTRRFLLGCLAIVVFILLALIAWAGYWSVKAVSALRVGNFHRAELNVRRAQPVVNTWSLLTLRQLPDLEAWRTGLDLVTTIPGSMKVSTTALSQLPQSANEGQSLAELPTLTQLHTFNEYFQQSHLLKFLNPELTERVNLAATTVTAIQETVLTGTHNWLILFQNTDELRATGGFMGSYAIVTLTDGQLTQIDIQDIYVPDGQFTGYVEAPAGHREYLSSGQGMRLPDANWWPDFPSSANHILPFFAEGEVQNIDGVIAINLSLAEAILKIVGPINLPDYNATVTAENLAEVARADREGFFPGSTAKTNFLSNLFTHLKLKLTQLSPDEQRLVAQQVKAALQTKTIQMYANNPDLQRFFESSGVAGQLTQPGGNQSDQLYLHLVESNVSINKANRFVTRSVTLETQPTTSTLRVQFSNSHPPTPNVPSSNPLAMPVTHFHYANYQRLLLKPDATISQIQVGDQVLSTWDEELITAANGLQFKQIGFMVAVLESQQTPVEIRFTHPPLTDPTFIIPKQSGLPPTPYLITWDGETRELNLDRDTVVSF